MKALKILLLTFCFGVQATFITPQIAFPSTLKLAFQRAFIPSAHSNLYIPELPVADVIVYFNEVCLDSEYVESGDPTVVQKWTEPITYVLLGDYAERDFAVLQELTNQLNSIKGFPGIQEARKENEANLRIYCCDRAELKERMGSNHTNSDGAVSFWYNGQNEIYDGTICYLTNLKDPLRRSVILEEVYNGLGPAQDTTLRPDSIIYQYYSEPQALTEIDLLMLKLLYHPDMKCGMNKTQCEEVIRNLYY